MCSLIDAKLRSMRCLPRSLCTSPETNELITDVTAAAIVNTPNKMRTTVNARPDDDSGWISPKPTVASVVTVMYIASKYDQPSMTW